MQKTKLGISVGLFAAAIYMFGLINIVPAVLLAGYALLFEENEWLKKTAVKAIMIVVLFAVLGIFINFVSQIRWLISDFMYMASISFNMSMFDRVISVIETLLAMLRNIILLILGFMAVSQGNIKLGAVDSSINKHM